MTITQRYNKLAVQSNAGNELNAVECLNFTLDSRLEQDTFWLASWPLCEVLRFNDSRYDWLMLVPRIADCTEITQLSAPQYQQLTLEIQQLALLLQSYGQGHKLNVGALGNVVSQLHVHVVLRATDDPAWPGPVWGHSAAIQFTAETQATELQRWQAHL